MTAASSALLGLAAGAADTIGFYVTVRSFMAAGTHRGKRVLAGGFEAAKIAVIVTGLALLCLRANAPVAWIVGSALFSSFLGKMLVVLKLPGKSS